MMLPNAAQMKEKTGEGLPLSTPHVLHQQKTRATPLMPRVDSTVPLSLFLLHRLRPSSPTSPPPAFWSPIAAFAAATERARAGTLRPEDAHHLFDELLRQATPVPERFLNAFLAALAHAPASDTCRDGPALAVALFNRVRREEAGPRVVPRSVHTYNILMDCCCRAPARHPDLGLAIFGLFLRTGIKTNQIIVSTFLKCLCYAKRTDEAVDVLLHRMPDLGCSSDVVAYNTVIYGFCAEGKVSKACTLFHEMMRRGPVPNVVTYTSIIASLCKARAMDKAEFFFQQMVDNGVQPNEVTYTNMIHGYSTLGQWKQASKMFKEMTRQGLIPNIGMWNTFMASLRKHGRTREAAYILESMTANCQGPHTS